MDIDTIVCMHQGVENLLNLAKEKSIHFTFFINMGRAVCYRSTIGKILGVGRSEKRDSIVKLSAKEKLGLKGLLRTLLFNPEVGCRSPHILKRIVNEGHDLGLHGGKNHGAWHHNAGSWDRDKVREEIEWGINAMTKLGLPSPGLFASPGFTTPDNISHILSDLKFEALADAHTDKRKAIYADSEILDFKHANTRLLGEPGAVGYIESVIAGGVALCDVEEEMKKHMFQGDVILYDHPCFAGRQGLDKLSYIIDAWTGLGGEVVSLSELIR